MVVGAVNTSDNKIVSRVVDKGTKFFSLFNVLNPIIREFGRNQLKTFPFDALVAFPLLEYL
jgi:hypothetical protein